MYSEADLCLANRKVRICALQMAALLLPLLAVYAAGIVCGMRGLMLATLLAAFIICMFMRDLLLMPALRYRRFLNEMRNGLRRSTDCILRSLDAEEQMQDGVRVRTLHAELCDGGDSRIFYMNVSKLDQLPEMNREIRLVSYGRHAAAFEEI